MSAGFFHLMIAEPGLVVVSTDRSRAVAGASSCRGAGVVGDVGAVGDVGCPVLTSTSAWGPLCAPTTARARNRYSVPLVRPVAVYELALPITSVQSPQSVSAAVRYRSWNLATSAMFADGNVHLSVTDAPVAVTNWSARSVGAGIASVVTAYVSEVAPRTVPETARIR